MAAQILVLGTVALLLVALFGNWAKPSYLFLGAVFIFLFFGVLTPEEVLKGLSNKQIVVIFLLVLLVSGLRKIWGDQLFQYLFLPHLRPKQFLLRMMVMVSVVSPFINNTPIVAFMIPYVKEWLDNRQLPVSKFLIPLSFATIMAGMITVVGTSTNLLLSGMMSEAGLAPLHFTDFLFPGLLVTVLGIVYLYWIGYHLLPDRPSATQQLEQNLNEFVVETVVEPSATLVGEPVQKHLRHLKDIYLFEIIRNGKSIFPVSPKEIVQTGDRLYFSGQTSAIAHLVKDVKGLSLPNTTTLNKYRHHNCLEAFIPANSVLVGKKVNESNFREEFNASIIAIHREGRRLATSVGETVLSAGDLVLLLQGEKSFPRSNDLFVFKRHDMQLLPQPKGKWKKLQPVFVIILLVMGITGVLDLFIAAALGILLLALSRLLNVNDTKASFDLDLAVMLVCSLAVGLALSRTGVASWIVSGLEITDHPQPIVAIGLLFAITLLITAIVSNAAALAIVFPFGVSLASQLNISPVPVMVAIAFAASGDFMTPTGYQTNLMVFGPGNYTFKDFFKVGFPLTLLYAATCLSFIYWFYKL